MRDTLGQQALGVVHLGGHSTQEFVKIVERSTSFFMGLPGGCLSGFWALLPGARADSWLRVGSQNDDPRQVREGQEAINRPNKRNQEIQQFDLPEAEGFLL